MRIYIASPYAVGNVQQNVKFACDIADEISRLGHFPYVPHLTMYWHRPPKRSHEFWQQNDFEWLRLCDAVLRIGGESPGADAEVAEAERLGIPVYYSINDLEMIYPTRDEYKEKLRLFRAWIDAIRNGIATKEHPDFLALQKWLADNFSADKIRLFQR